MLFSATIAAGGAFIIGRTFLRQFVEEIIDGSRKFQAGFVFFEVLWSRFRVSGSDSSWA